MRCRSKMQGFDGRIRQHVTLLFISLTWQELDVCDKEASAGGDVTVYKQVGPVLMKNDLDEARETIEKRLEFITGEM